MASSIFLHGVREQYTFRNVSKHDCPIFTLEEKPIEEKCLIGRNQVATG